MKLELKAEPRLAGHWKSETFIQRVTKEEWKSMLLKGQDQVIYRGRLRQLKAKALGVGVYELSKVPLEYSY